MNRSDFRIVYAGTPGFAVQPLAAVVEAGYDVVAVYTQPDRRAGRGRKVSMSPVKECALEHNIVVEQPHSLRDAEQQALLKSYQPDLMIVAAYGQILPIEVLTTPVHGCLNIHASLLPRWRGAAPIQRAIEAGDEKSGVTIMQMDKGLDTGDMLFKVECDIDINTTGAQLHDQLAVMGTDALMQTLEQLHLQKLSPQAQSDADSNYAKKIEKSEAVLDWSQSAVVLHRKICAFNSWPVAQTILNGEVIRVWESSLHDEATGIAGKPGEILSTDSFLEVATGEGVLRIHQVQPPGKKAMKVTDFLNSRAIAKGLVLADADVRLQATRILTSLVRDGKSLSELLPSAQLDLEPQHAALMQELTYGVCRSYAKLDGIVDQLLKKSLRNKDTDVRMLLWLALYEIGFMRTPDYAVTSSYVDLTKKIKKPWAKALINGTLRQYLRNQKDLTDEAIRKNPHSLPEWIQKTVLKDWPDQASSVFEAFNSRAPLTLRANSAVTNRDKLSEALTSIGVESEPCEHAKTGLRVIDGPPVTSLPGFAEGEFSVQDQSAQLAAFLLNPQPSEKVLDACAAPGGKSCHLLELEPSIDLTCLDNNADRMRRVEQNLQRLHLKAKLVTADAAAPDDWWDEQAFDAILLDAPCSALGALRRHPDIRLLRRESDIKALGKQQIALLRALWPILKPGGRLIYATCSVLKQENEKCVAKFLAETPSAVEVTINQEWGAAATHGRQILPGENQADGFYYAILQKQ